MGLMKRVITGLSQRVTCASGSASVIGLLHRRAAIDAISGTNSRRCISSVSTILESGLDIETKVKKMAIGEYHKNKEETDKHMEEVLSENPLVLYMHGTPDWPKSALSLNVIKVMTLLQTLPLTCVDVLGHPAIVGYVHEKSKGVVGGYCPLLFFKGRVYGDHDGIMHAYQTGMLRKDLGAHLTRTPKHAIFGETLPAPVW
eukprot:Filipodium_phascolosomae@DN1350_c0_g1_i1.p1